jgi:hypothetical protein
MCDECGGRVCAMLDGLIADYWRDFPRRAPRDFNLAEAHRPRYVPMDVRNAPKSAERPMGLLELAEHADDMGLSRDEFVSELKLRSQYAGPIDGWLSGKLPFGLIRKIILTCAEQILREQGARPQYSLLQAA